MFCRNNYRSAFLLLLVLAFLSTQFARAQTVAQTLEQLKKDARTALTLHQTDRALKDYEKAAAAAPDDIEVKLERATLLKTMTRVAEAIAAFTEVLQLDPQNEAAELGLADAYRMSSNFDEARRTIARAQQDHPASAAPLVALGELDFDAEKYDDAIRQFQASLRIAPENEDAQVRLGAAQLARGEAEQAIESLSAAIAREPNDVAALYLRASAYFFLNDMNRASSDTARVLELRPGLARGRLLFGKVLVHTGRCEQAARVLEPLTTGESPDAQGLYLLWQAYRCMGREEPAQQALARFEKISKQARLEDKQKAQSDQLVHQATALALSNQLEKSAGFLQQAIARDPENGPAYLLLAKIYFAQHRVADARQAIEAALRIDPNNAEHSYVLGRVLEEEGKLDEALRAFQKAVLIYPREADAYYEIGRISVQRKDRASAINAFKKAVEISPDNPKFRRALAEVSADTDPG